MKLRSAAIQGGLALIGLIAAYLTWQRPQEESKADLVTVVSATKQSLDRVHFEDGTRFLDVVRHTEGTPRLWVTLGFLPGKTPVFDAGVPAVLDGGVDGGALVKVTPPPEPPPTRETLANDRADSLFAKFTPLEAQRALGTLSKDKLDELGLVGSERKLDVYVAGAPRSFVVSKPVSGIIGSYAQDTKTGEVFLLQSSVFSELDPSSSLLVERRPHAFKQAEFDRFVVKVDGKEAEFVQTNAEIPQTAKVARASSPDKPDEMAKNWHDKIWNRLIVTEVLGKGELPKAGEPKVQLRLEYSGRGSPKGWLEIGADPAGSTWMRSENTASWVSVHQGAEELVLEAKKIIAP